MAEMAVRFGHEVNNTLATIVLRTELLAEDVPPSGPARDSVTVIEKATKEGVALVRRVRELARLSRPLVRRPVDWAHVLDDALEAVRPRLVATPAVTIAADRVSLRRISGDRGELALALRELLDNAIDAMEHGGAVRLTTGVEHGVLRCRVVDGGPGLVPAASAQAFDPFFSTRPERGRGLGLTLALTVAARHGGDVRLARGAGGGTSATLRVPCANAGVAQARGPRFR
jgi:signal transduction histidine kinase